MKTRNFVLLAAGVAAAISFEAGTAAAQAKSDTRIPVRKDAPATTAAKVDTIRITTVQHDTVMVRVKPDTIIRTTTVTGPTVMVHDPVIKAPPYQKLPGLYFGVGAGVASPLQNFNGWILDGLDLNGQVGYFPAEGAIGVRADVNWASMNHRGTNCTGCPNVQLASLMGDIVWRMPLDRPSKMNAVFYLMGGGGIDKFSDFIPYRNDAGKIVTAGSNTNVNNPPATLLGVTAANRGTSSVNFDWNVGGGLDWNLFGAHWFLETRYVNIATTGGNTHYMPSILGLKFY